MNLKKLNKNKNTNIAIIVITIIAIFGVAFFYSYDQSNQNSSSYKCNVKTIDIASKKYSDSEIDEVVKIGGLVRSDESYASNIDCLYLSAYNHINVGENNLALKEIEKANVVLSKELNSNKSYREKLPAELISEVLEGLSTNVQVNTENSLPSAYEFPPEPPLSDGGGND